MKKIINGKLYNTETAKKLAEFQSSRPSSDFEYFEESLYQKRTGEYFLAGSGNALSKYSKSYDDYSLGSGERITPISYSQAQQWAERHISADSYIKLFGDPEDDTKQVATYSLSASAVQKAKREAAKRSISVSEFIEQLILKA